MTAPFIPYDERPYRPCVGIFLINDSGMVFAGRRIDSRAEAWQMPQGGIDLGETPLEACLREMEEEIGTRKATVLHEIEDWLNYDIPMALAERLWHGQYKGQKQKWMLLQYYGADADITFLVENSHDRSEQLGRRRTSCHERGTCMHVQVSF